MVSVPLTATYATAGTFTWTCPAGVTSVTVACTGAGGGAGAAAAASGSNGGGGGGGEAALEPALAVTPGKGYTVTVGAAGAGGTQGGNGTAGGDTSFPGDTQTVYAHGGQGGTAGNATGAGQGAAGGTGSTNTVSADGGAGDDGTAATNGGGGGGAAGTSTTAGFPGNAAAGATAGAASLGTWPGGAGGNGATTGAAGSAGSGPGGGGGGGLSTGSAHAGGSGGAGQVVITWTMTDPVTLTADTAGGTWQFTAPLGASAVTAQAWGGGAGGYDVTPSAVSLAGASVFAPQYGTPKYTTGANTFDGRVGRQMAHAVQKIYYQEEEYPSASSDSQQAAQMVAQGMKLFVMFKCSRRAVVAGGSTLATQQSNLTAAIAYLQSIPGINFTVAIGNEPNVFGQHGPFGDGTMKDWTINNVNADPYGAGPFTQPQVVAHYAAYSAAYAPIVAAAGVQVAYNPAAGAAPIYAQAMFPGVGAANGGCDFIMADYYSGDLFNGTNLFGTGTMEAVADANGMAFGLGEYGQSKSMLDSYWGGTFIPMMLTGWQNRFSGGKKVADIIFFGGQDSGATNFIASSTDYHIPGLQQVFDLFAAQSSGQVGGAGGGGGEFAAENSLAITSLKSYTLTVGQGGTARAAGTVSTIAGDSVTVTAHGGSVATATTAGGAGGTGSTNSTHHDGGAGGAGGGSGAGGGGGGGSGGTAANGNAGSPGHANTKGAGAAAVTGGGPGGDGGGPNASGSPPVSGPGGGGGARGANGVANGAGQDGQIVLSGFTVGTGSTGGFALAPLALAGTGGAPSGNFALAPPHLSGQCATGLFRQVQNGVTATSSAGVTTPTLPAPSTKGTLLVVVLATASQVPILPPPRSPWQLAVAQNSGGSAGRIEIWYMTGDYNGGGITSAAFATNQDTRGHMAEYAGPAGTTQALDGTPGSASGGAPTTSFPVSASGFSAGGDLGIAAFEDKFSASNTSQSWTTPATPAGWTLNNSQVNGLINAWSSYFNVTLSAGAQSVTGAISTSTNQTGWSAAIAVFTAVPLITTTGAVALAGTGLSAAGSAVLGPGQVAASGGIALAPLAFQSPSQAVTFPQQPLPVVVEILVNGTWTDITHYVYTRDLISITGRGRPDEASAAQPTQATLTLNNRDGSFSPQNTAGRFFGFLARNTQIRISVLNAVTPTGASYNGNGTGNGYRFWGEIPSWPPLWNIAQTDFYVSITAAGVLQRMRQSKFSASPLGRYYANIINAAAANPGSNAALVPAGYWPCEDASGATSFTSGIPGGSPMTFSGGTIALAADSNVPGCAPFAQLNGSVWTGTPGAFTSGGITYATPGTYTWTCPGGITTILAECWGGGGGAANGFFSGGGGGGEYAAEPNLAVTPGKTYTLTVGTGGSGAPGSSSKKGGSDGQKSTFGGDSVTVTAAAGGGATASGGAGKGGSGSGNTTHHSGGNGAAQSAGRGGSGGGGSGGSSASGHNGSTGPGGSSPGSGGSAVTGGGPGGTGGMGSTTFQTADGTPGQTPSPGPGGGGGGGGFNGGPDYGLPGGNGAAGQVRITFGATPTPSAVVLRAVVDVPSGGGTDQANLVACSMGGTVATLNLIYRTGGNLQMVGKSASGSTLFDSGSKSFSLNGKPALISGELTQAGTSINWKLTAVAPGASAVTATYKGTITGTLGAGGTVNVNNASGHTDTLATGVCQVSLQYAVDPILNLSQALNAYTGELAATRFIRLCAEQNVPVSLTGNATDTPQMGPQPGGLLASLLQDCETADLGQMFERRDAFGMGYRTRASLQNQPPSVVLDYGAGQLSAPLAPTNDDQLTHNDITVTRTNGAITGSSTELLLSTGAMSVQDPPNGVGLYSYAVSANLFSDAQLVPYAQWLLTLGTLDEYRFPVITVDLRRSQLSGGTFSAMASLDIGGYLQIINSGTLPGPAAPPMPINQLAFGFTETIGPFLWTIAVNAVPEDPYSSGGSGSESTFPTW